MKRIIQLASVVALVIVASSCATIDSGAGGVQVSLVNLSARAATVLETTMMFTIRLDNENPEPIRLSGAVHKIYINGSHVGQGVLNEEIEVPRLSSTTQTFTAHLRNLSMASRIRGLIESKRFEYRIDSVLYGASGNRRMRVSNSGVLDLNDLKPGQP